MNNPFDRGGAAYAAHRPDYPPELAAALARACARRGHGVDIGCGSGQLTALLAPHFDRVTGIDPSASQIAHATPAPGVTYATGRAEATGLPDGCADLIVAAQAAHWFDLPAFYAEARRIARPGAVLALVSYGVPVIAGPGAAAFARFYWHDIHAHWPPARRHVETGYRDLPFPFAPLAIAAPDITRDWDWAALRGYIDTWSATRAAARAGVTLAPALARLARGWGPPDVPRRVRWPVTIRAARIAPGQAGPGCGTISLW